MDTKGNPDQAQEKRAKAVPPVSIVIPCYNESETIKQVLEDFSSIVKDFSCEIIVVDDGSVDNTYEIISKLNLPIRIIRHRHNKGKGAALKTAISSASNEVIIAADADGQHKSKYVRELLKYSNDYDMVIGARKGMDPPWWKIPGRWIVRKLSEYLVRQKIPDVNSGFRLFKKSTIQKYFHLCSDGISFCVTSTLSYLSDGLEIKYVNIEAAKREKGKSKVNIHRGLRILLLVLQIIIVFNPLRVFLPISFLFLLSGVTYLICDIIQINITDTSILLISVGTILFVFAMLADQISTLRREIKRS